MTDVQPEIEIILPNPGEWGGADADSLLVLRDTASLLARHFPRRPTRLNVVGASDGKPRAILGSPTIALALELPKRRYNQLAYQFSHELFHKLAGDDRLAGTVHCTYQIDEILAEVASLFTLRRLRDKWLKHAPFYHWCHYAPNFETYALETERSFWTVAQSPIYADPIGNPVDRPRNGLVAVQLVPLMLAQPELWAATQHLPSPAQDVREFLEQWINGCPLPTAATSLCEVLRRFL